jgi:putative ATP-dependent endonuclease of OLD family
MGVGVAEPTFQSIVRALRILMTNAAMKDFDPSSNGLGMNNILFVSIVIEYFFRRLAQKKSAGQIILFEEPEAHLHPQLQLSLFSCLNALPFQCILTTHSTHITAHARLLSYVVLTQTGTAAIASSVPATSDVLAATDVADLERYLDATKSNLLYARKVMLVEGPAEQFLIPALAKSVRQIDLDREGIAVIPIFGIHFDVYAKLFGEHLLPKKCAIVTDGDMKPSDADREVEGEDEIPSLPDLDELEGDFVRVFRCKTTFERALTLQSTLAMLADAAEDIGAPIVAGRLRNGLDDLQNSELKEEERKSILSSMRGSVLNTAIRFGKARFSQVASRHVGRATGMPKYIDDAIDWLMEE